MPQIKLSVQSASDAVQIPSKAQFKKWAKATLRVDTEVTIRIVDEAEGKA